MKSNQINSTQIEIYPRHNQAILEYKPSQGYLSTPTDLLTATGHGGRLLRNLEKNHGILVQSDAVYLQESAFLAPILV
jgi:hypothetical protein